MERPASRLLAMVLDRIQAEAQRQVLDAINAEAEMLGLDPRAQFDPQRRVWLLPADAASEEVANE